MAVSGSRMEYQDPDIREMREYVAARRAMSHEAYDRWAAGSSSNRIESSAGTGSTEDSLPALEITSGEQNSGQTGSQIDLVSSRSLDGTANVTDARGPVAESAGLIDRVSSSETALGSVDASQVQSGLQRNVFSSVQFGNYERPQDVANALQWLDGQIPRDGTMATEDRRTALLIATASATAQLRTDDPVRQQELAYDYLFALRQGITRYGDQLPEGMAGRRGDPDIAAAEHYFENSRFVTGNALQVGDLRIPVPSLISATGMAYADLIYQYGKRFGLISGSSQPGNFQTGWEFAGIIDGLGGGYVPPEAGRQDSAPRVEGDDVDRIVIIGDRLSNENTGTESGVGNVDTGTIPSGGAGAESGIDSNGRADSGILADGGGGYEGGGYDSGGYGGGGYGGGGYGVGGGGGGSLFLFNNE